MSSKVKTLLRKLVAIIFGGFFLFGGVAHILYSPHSILAHPVAEFIIQSIIGWLTILVLPVVGAFLMYRNKRSGIVIVSTYVAFILVTLIVSLVAPDFFAS